MPTTPTPAQAAVAQVRWQQAQGMLPADLPAQCIAAWLASPAYVARPGLLPTHAQVRAGVHAAHAAHTCPVAH